MAEKKKSTAQKVKDAAAAAIHAAKEHVVQPVGQALGLTSATDEKAKDARKPVAEQKPAEPVKQATPAPAAKPVGGTIKAKETPKPVAEQKPAEPAPAPPTPTPAAKPAGGTSAAARMLTRSVAGKMPTAGTAKARRAADAARSSQKPVAGAAGPKIRRGTSKGR